KSRKRTPLGRRYSVTPSTVTTFSYFAGGASPPALPPARASWGARARQAIINAARDAWRRSAAHFISGLLRADTGNCTSTRTAPLHCRGDRAEGKPRRLDLTGSGEFRIVRGPGGGPVRTGPRAARVARPRDRAGAPPAANRSHGDEAKFAHGSGAAAAAQLRLQLHEQHREGGPREIGRASCRERSWMWTGAVFARRESGRA